MILTGKNFSQILFWFRKGAEIRYCGIKLENENEITPALNFDNIEIKVGRVKKKIINMDPDYFRQRLTQLFICDKYCKEIIGKKSKWIVNESSLQVHVEISGNKKGYAGRTIHFPISKKKKISIKGPWHSNSIAFFNDTGYVLPEPKVILFNAGDDCTDRYINGTGLIGIIEPGTKEYIANNLCVLWKLKKFELRILSFYYTGNMSSPFVYDPDYECNIKGRYYYVPKITQVI